MGQEAASVHFVKVPIKCMGDKCKITCPGYDGNYCDIFHQFILNRNRCEVCKQSEVRE